MPYVFDFFFDFDPVCRAAAQAQEVKRKSIVCTMYT